MGLNEDNAEACKRTYAAIADATASFVRGAGFEDVVIGLSGGIDSALVATIAVDALSASHVHGMLLPGPYSSEGSLRDARELASNLGIETMTVSIDEPYAAFVRALSEAAGHPLDGLAAENTQARCRMVCLMAMSNLHGWMMLNTGNRSEAAMGYSTLYGDTAGAFAPIGGVFKTDVFALARWRNSDAKLRGEVPPIPESIIEKPPSAELSPDQTDEASLGIEYAELDAILAAYLDGGKTAEEIVACGHSDGQVNMVLLRYATYAYKRDIEPPFPEV